MLRFVIVSLGTHVLLAGAVVLVALHGGPEDDVPDFDPSGALLGETMTLDLEHGEVAQAGAEAAPGDEAAAPGAAEAAPEPTPVVKAAGEGAEASKPAPRATRATSAGGGEAGGGADKDVGLFGAVGERSAADLATAFVRGFPQVASVDPAWAKVKLGPLASATIELTLSEEGRIVAHDVISAPEPLAQALDRTVGLLRGRKFTARGAKTKLTLKCVVSADSVYDGLHGEVFAVGASFAGKTGNAFFALASGRRIDVDVSLGR